MNTLRAAVTASLALSAPAEAGDWQKDVLVPCEDGHREVIHIGQIHGNVLFDAFADNTNNTHSQRKIGAILDALGSSPQTPLTVAAEGVLPEQLARLVDSYRNQSLALLYPLVFSALETDITTFKARRDAARVKLEKELAAYRKKEALFMAVEEACKKGQMNFSGCQTALSDAKISTRADFVQFFNDASPLSTQQDAFYAALLEEFEYLQGEQRNFDAILAEGKAIAEFVENMKTQAVTENPWAAGAAGKCNAAGSCRIITTNTPTVEIPAQEARQTLIDTAFAIVSVINLSDNLNDDQRAVCQTRAGEIINLKAPSVDLNCPLPQTYLNELQQAADEYQATVFTPREDDALAQIDLGWDHEQGFIPLIYGGRHDFTDNVIAWNQANPERPLCLSYIDATAQ